MRREHNRAAGGVGRRAVLDASVIARRLIAAKAPPTLTPRDFFHD